MLTPEEYKRAWSLLEDITPLSGIDCGQLCQSKCCSDWREDVGIYLYPGEECMLLNKQTDFIWEVHTTQDYEFCPSWQGEYFFLRCPGKCKRHLRPLQCRLFPLSPYITPSGKVGVFLSPAHNDICPLTKEKIASINPLFITACLQVWQILLKDRLIYEDVLWTNRHLDFATLQLKFY